MTFNRYEEFTVGGPGGGPGMAIHLTEGSSPVIVIRTEDGLFGCNTLQCQHKGNTYLCEHVAFAVRAYEERILPDIELRSRQAYGGFIEVRNPGRRLGNTAEMMRDALRRADEARDRAITAEHDRVLAQLNEAKKRAEKKTVKPEPIEVRLLPLDGKRRIVLDD